VLAATQAGRLQLPDRSSARTFSAIIIAFVFHLASHFTSFQCHLFFYSNSTTKNTISNDNYQRLQSYLMLAAPDISMNFLDHGNCPCTARNSRYTPAVGSDDEDEQSYLPAAMESSLDHSGAKPAQNLSWNGAERSRFPDSW